MQSNFWDLVSVVNGCQWLDLTISEGSLLLPSQEQLGMDNECLSSLWCTDSIEEHKSRIARGTRDNFEVALLSVSCGCVWMINRLWSRGQGRIFTKLTWPLGMEGRLDRGWVRWQRGLGVTNISQEFLAFYAEDLILQIFNPEIRDI